MRAFTVLVLCLLCSAPVAADQRFAGFVLAGGAYRVTPQVSSVTYARADSLNHGVSWVENTFDRDVLAPMPGVSFFSGLNYVNAHFSSYVGQSYESSINGDVSVQTKAGANVKLSPLAQLYQGFQLRGDYACRRDVKTRKNRCTLRPDFRYDWIVK